MNTFLIILIVVAAFITILLILALLVKKNYVLVKEITLNKPKQDVFNYIKLLKNQGNYSKWMMMDPNVKLKFKGKDGTVGFVLAWDSKIKEVGKGEQSIKKITEGERIDLDIHFIRPYEGKAVAYLSTEPLNERQTKVKWGFTGEIKYPMNLMLLFMNMDKMVGNDLATGLTNLKDVFERHLILKRRIK
jgi:hypothetical protein